MKNKKTVSQLKKSIMAVLIVAFSIISLAAAGCDYKFTGRGTREERTRSAAAVNIGVVWPVDSEYGAFVNGIKMAENEINGAGGLLGKKINLIVKNDKSNVTTGMIIADEFASDLEVSAVLGFCDSFVTVPVSHIYNKAGILMLNILSISPEYNSFKSPLLFRTIPNANDIARKFSSVLKKLGYKKVVICYEQNEYGISSANANEDDLKKNMISVTDRRSYTSGGRNEFEKITEYWKLLDFDCILLFGDTINIAELIKMLRQNHITQPIFCGDSMDTKEFLKAAEGYADGLILTAFFAPETTLKTFPGFAAEYEKKFGTPPDAYAVFAYDALKLLARSIKAAGSASPQAMAKAMHSFKNEEGLLNAYSFNDCGDTINSRVIFKIIDGDKFKFLSETGEIDAIKKAAINNEKWK